MNPVFLNNPFIAVCFFCLCHESKLHKRQTLKLLTDRPLDNMKLSRFICRRTLQTPTRPHHSSDQPVTFLHCLLVQLIFILATTLQSILHTHTLRHRNIRVHTTKQTQQHVPYSKMCFHYSLCCCIKVRRIHSHCSEYGPTSPLSNMYYPPRKAKCWNRVVTYEKTLFL